MKYCFFAVLCCCALSGCIEPYEPEVGPYDSTLVVDGFLTDSEDAATVILSRSFSFAEDEPEFISGAGLMIEDEAGGQALLTEQAPGVYQTDPAAFRAQPGRSYRLLISTPDGGQFASDWELLKPSPPIEKVYFEYEERPSNDPVEPLTPGVQFFLDTRDTENNTRFYRWEFEETYEYVLWHPPYYEPRFGSPPAYAGDTLIPYSFDEFEGQRCWKTEKSRKLYIASTEAFTEDIVQAFPLHYVDNSTYRLSWRYSILTKQYAISREYYQYLKKLEETNETTGSLFDPIPNEVFGNIHSTDGRDIPVLGYFSAAGVSTSRIFADYQDVPPVFSAPVGPDCKLDTIPLSFRVLQDQLRYSFNVFHNILYNPFGTPIGYLLTRPQCSRCATLDATNQRPEFW